MPESRDEAGPFLAALEEALQSARGSSFSAFAQGASQLLPHLPAPTPAALDSLLASAAFDPRALPDRRANLNHSNHLNHLNQVMNLLPPAWRELILVRVVGALFGPERRE